MQNLKHFSKCIKLFHCCYCFVSFHFIK